MFVIVTYDAAAKRTARLLKICRRYLLHTQRSVFEGEISEAQLERMKREIKKQIVPGHDSVQIYKFNSLRYSSKEVLGCIPREEHIL